VLGLQHGLWAALLQQFVMNGVRLGCYDAIKHALTDAMGSGASAAAATPNTQQSSAFAATALLSSSLSGVSAFCLLSAIKRDY
jgi:hypothetical protein